MIVSDMGLIDADMTIAQSFPDLFLPPDCSLARTRLIDLARHVSPLGQIEGTILKTPGNIYRDPIPIISAPRLLAHIGKNRSGRDRGVYHKFVYSDFGYALLGIALERYTGLGYGALVGRHISQKPGTNYREIFPSIHYLSLQDRERVAAKLPKSFGVLDSAFGGLATARGLSLFVHDLVSGRFLSRRATARLVHTPIPFGPAGQGYAYGMGIARFPVGPFADGDACLGHLCVFQSTSGFAAHHYGSGMTICFLANALSGMNTDGQRRDLNPGGLVRRIFVDANDLGKNEARLKRALSSNGTENTHKLAYRSSIPAVRGSRSGLSSPRAMISGSVKA